MVSARCCWNFLASLAVVVVVDFDAYSVVIVINIAVRNISGDTIVDIVAILH